MFRTGLSDVEGTTPAYLSGDDSVMRLLIFFRPADGIDDFGSIAED
jgi:hypothetical protein